MTVDFPSHANDAVEINWKLPYRLSMYLSAVVCDSISFVKDLGALTLLCSFGDYGFPYCNRFQFVPTWLYSGPFFTGFGGLRTFPLSRVCVCACFADISWCVPLFISTCVENYMNTTPRDMRYDCVSFGWHA